MIVDFSARCKFRVAGPDAQRYLNGQVTNDVRRLSNEEALWSCVLDNRGRIQAEVWIRRLEDAFLLDGPGPLRETLAARLERYLIADAVEIEDVTDAFHILFFEEETCSLDPLPSGVLRFRASRLGQPGMEFWTHGDKTLAPGGKIWGADDPMVKKLCIERGLPIWGHEINETTLPAEAGLDRAAVDFAKGCYVGQEVVSRMKSIGHPSRVLVRLIAAAKEPPLEEGAKLLDSHGKVVGEVTSAWEETGLGYVKWSCSEPSLNVIGTGKRVGVLSLSPAKAVVAG